METPPILSIRAGAMRRFGGFFVDSLVLGALGTALGFLAFSTFAAMGLWGRLVGLVISTAYFTLMLGPWGRGQTLGHRVFNLRVVALDGAPLALSARLIRALVITVPFMVNGVGFPAAIAQWPLLEWLATSVLGLILATGAANGYLLLFDRRNRRALHDRLAGTEVIAAEGTERTGPVPVWKGHWMVLGILALFVLGASAGGIFLSRTSFFAGVLQTQRAVEALPGVRAAGVMVDKSWTDGQTHTRYVVTVQVSRAPESYQALANAVAAVVLAQSPGARTSEGLAIAVVYGFNIGIATGTVRRDFSYPPAEWSRLR